MGTMPEKPIIGGENTLPDKHFKVRIDKDNIDDTFAIRELEHPVLGYIATLGWVGESTIRQLAIWSDRAREDEWYMSYEGYANFPRLLAIHTVIPCSGEVLKMKNNTRYFFNSYDPSIADPYYSLDSSNTSLIINNLSLFNRSHTEGLMINLRASFDGLIDDDEIGGGVNILCSIDSIG